MNTKDLATFLGKTKPTPEQALKGLKEVYTLARRNSEIIETERTKRKAIEAQERMEIEKIRAQKELLREYFGEAFKERRENFDKLFDALDKGIESNNLELIAGTLGAIVDIAKSSPIKHLQKMKDDFNNPDIKEIEF
jgi:hypothetical protein